MKNIVKRKIVFTDANKAEHILNDIPSLSIEEIIDVNSGLYPEITNAKVVNNGLQDLDTGEPYLLYTIGSILGTKA